MTENIKAGQKILTSYFANWRKYPEGFVPTSISMFPPKGFKGEALSELAPSQELLHAIKSGKISQIEYEKIYRLQLEALGPKKVADMSKGRILLCYEIKTDFCHRHILRHWLAENGISSEEA